MALAAWLKKCGVTTVAMESTGVYWTSLFRILESRGFEVKLVNAAHVKNVPGRKTDVKDCQWLQQLHSCGLLRGSFQPDEKIRVLRSYWRHRDNLIRYASSHVQHMQKALEQMNLKLVKVVSDITGVTGMSIIRAMLEGERDPVKLAAMKDPRIRSSSEEIAMALEGDYRQEHLFALKQAVEIYDIYHQKIRSCDCEIENYLKEFESKSNPESNPLSSPKKGKNRVRGNRPEFDLQSHLYRISGVDFTQIDGLSVMTVQTIISEVGLYPDAFPTEKHFGSWLGLCPANKITGGKVKSSRTRKVVNRVADAFRMAAQAVIKSNSALGAFYRRMRAKLGGPKAITATAYKIARLFYRLWKTGVAYKDPGADYYDQKYKDRVVKNMVNRVKQLGYDVVLTQTA
ncbi:MAG: IS110 family transposase [Deltaproteobacteria bacterium]|nr:IS110 family transposase [Deltaproteobacteria bacterium]